MEMKTKLIGKYVGHSVKNNQIVDWNLACQYAQLPEVVRFTLGLNVDCELAVLFEDSEKPQKLGTFRISGISIDREGDSKIKFNSMTEYINLDILNAMSSHGDEDITIYAKYVIESGEDGGGDAEVD